MWDWLSELGGTAADTAADSGEWGSAAGDFGASGVAGGVGGWGSAIGDTAGAVAPAASDIFDVGGAALDAANPAFTPGGSWTGYMPDSTGVQPTEVVQPLDVHPVDPQQGDLGTASTLSRGSAVANNQLPTGNDLEMTDPGSQPVQQASPMSQFRQSVGAVPGKWWQSLTDAPKNAADYVGNNPGKTLMAAGTLGMNMYRASQGQPGAPKSPLSAAPTPSFPAPQARPAAAPSASPLVDVSETPRSPLLANYDVKRSGGFNIGR